MEKKYLAILMWLCEGQLKVRTAHFRLPSASNNTESFPIRDSPHCPWCNMFVYRSTDRSSPLIIMKQNRYAHFCQLQVNNSLKQINQQYYFNIKNEVTYQIPSKCWEVGSVGFNSIAFCKDK